MELKSQEHQDVVSQFDREGKGLRLDKEPRAIWSRGRIYQDGHVNEQFLAYRRGYALAKSVYQQNGSVSVSASAEPSGELGAQRQESSSVQEGATAVNVRELLEHASDVASESRKIIQASVDREYVTNESAIANVCRDLSTLAIHLRAANEALRQSSPRSQPVTSASIEEAKMAFDRALALHLLQIKDSHLIQAALDELIPLRDALITAVRQGQ